MANFNKLPLWTDDGAFHVVVETPRGSGVKLKWDPKLQAFTLKRLLPAGMVYPWDWGFIPGTRAPDGDPLDAMVLLDVPTAPGVVLECKAVGVLRVTQAKKKKSGRERNDRVIARATEDERHRDARELPERMREELAHFFEATVAFEGKEIRVEGWDGPRAAQALIRQAARRRR